jgi:molybdopterin-synthase adenylyltransferase
MEEGMLTFAELKRYQRQTSLPELGETGQVKLKRARVVICGAGGLGSPAAIYLAAAGIGSLRIIDFDHVSLDNLNRQILHGHDDIDRLKVDSAKQTLKNLNPDIAVEVFEEKITVHNIQRLVSSANVVIDALDNFETRYIVNKAAVQLRIPLVHGAIKGFEGRALTIVPGKSACLRCMHPGAAPPANAFPVIGVTPGVIGAIQATEAIKLVLGIGTLLTNRLVVYDGLCLTLEEFALTMNPLCPHCGHLQKRE